MDRDKCRRREKRNTGALLGAAFIMATSAVGPGFLTQTAKFTADFKGSFGFVILFSTLLSVIVQLNVWRVLCISGMRGQEVANAILPGLGYFVALLVIIGGLIFNIGNVGGGALGFQTVFGIAEPVGCILTGGIAIAVFLLRNAAKAMDTLTKVLCGIMIIVVFIVIVIVKPPIGTAVRETVLPSAGVLALLSSILTLLGGTVGGYITFAGAHRLLDAGINGEKRVREITRSSVIGIVIATIVRMLLFLAVFGVVAAGASLDASNPAADAFRKGAGKIGYIFFGVVLLCAAVTSVVGAAYTSVSFLKTFHPILAKEEKWVTVGFIAVSTVLMALLGKPARLLIIAGALNGLILPVTLGVCLVASRRKAIMGEHYRHPVWLFWLGILVVCIAAYMGITSLSDLGSLFA